MAVVMPSLGGPTAACWRGSGLYRLGRGGREAWLTCRPANAAAWTNARLSPSAERARACCQATATSGPASRVASSRLQKAKAKSSSMGSSPLSHPNGYCLGPLAPQSLQSTPQAVLIHGLHQSSRGQNQAGKARASRLRAASSAWPGAIKAHEAVAYVAQEHSGESTGCARRIEVLEACLDRAQPKP